jgi:glucose/arabinose dehydrogenase
LPPAATTGSLQVVITALPAGANGAVRVTGPNNFAQDLTSTQTLSNLAPGSYSVSAANATLGSATFTPTPATQSVVVSAGATATATVTYASSALTLALSDIGPSFTSPTFVTAPPGDERLFVLERRGVIRVVQNGSVLTQPWLDISSNVFTGGEGGLLSMAFDPNFASNGYFYLYYTDPARTSSSSATRGRPRRTWPTRLRRWRSCASPTRSSRTISAAWSPSGRTACSTPARAMAAAPATRSAMPRT